MTKSITTKYFTALLLMLLYINVQAQYQMEKLDRGVLAIRTGNNNFISWRWLGTENDISFNLYRNGTKVNSTPLTVTNYTDNGAAVNASYTVRAVVNGTEQAASAAATPWAQNYLQIPLQIPPGGTTPSGEAYTYNANDCSLADLDGDGAWEIIVKWDPSNSKDNSQSGYTGNHYIDAYKLNGTRMWRIDFGRNVRAGAHYLDFMVFDFDSDGKAEMMARTADATIDGTGVVIGNANADYRTTAGYVLSGPEYTSVFNGITGKEMARRPLYPPRGTVGDWGDTYGNRVDRFKACVAYLDGKMPSAVFIRGYYAKWGAEALDWRGGKLTSKWTYMCPNVKTDPCYEEGAHSVSVADVDDDGKQEVIMGSNIIDDNGTMYYNTAIGHGDALHVSDMDPSVPGIEISHIQEPVGNAGLYMYSGKSKKVLWRIASASDATEGPGRGVCADITAKFPGCESWVAGGGISGVFDTKGVKTTLAGPQSCNFLAWWDGDLLRELLNGTMIDKYETGRLLTVSGCSSNNGTKSTPALSGDFFGDWREEVMWRTSDNKYLRIYSTTIPSNYKIRTLMHDPQYRVAIAWQNTGYNQPPHLGYFLGDGMATPTKPNITIVGGDNIANLPPTGNITSPLNNATFTATASITINANAADSDGSVAKVEFFNGANKLGEDLTATYSYAWTNVAAGTYSLTVKITDNEGAVTTSSAVNITVTSSNVAPTVSITSPLNNAIINGSPANLTLAANANDTDGNIAKVEFFEGTNKLGEDASAPYTQAWANVAAGTYTLTAVATDNGGTSTTSATITISIVALPTDCNGVQNGSATLDACFRCIGGNTGKTACNAISEAENDTCALDGVFEATNEGFGGDGYINTNNSATSYFEFAVFADVAKTATLSIRYANGTAASRPGQLLVNKVALPNNIEFVTTGAWNDWDIVEVQVPLLQGNNRIRLNSTTATGLPNIDQIGYVSAGVKNGSCSVVTNLDQEELSQHGINVYPNPSHGHFNLELTQHGDVKVLSATGAVIENLKDVKRINFGERYHAGIYNVHVTTREVTYVFKIVKN